MLAALLAVALGAGEVPAQPQAVVLVSRRSGLSVADANELARAVSKALGELKVPLALDADAARAALTRLGLNDASACNGRMRCVTELARQLSAVWVITISLARVGEDRSIGLELIREAAVVEREAVVLSGQTPLKPDDLSAFASRLHRHLGVTPTTEPVKDVPVVVQPPPPLTPRVEPAPPVFVAPVVPPPRSRAVPVGLAIGAGAALVAGTVLALVGGSTRAEAYRVEVVDGVRRSPYSASQTRQLATEGTAALGVGSGLGAVALGLGAAAVLTW